MSKTIEESIEWIHSRLPFGMRPGLERVEALLALVDYPEKKVPMIHIAGTNGKGSTVSYLKNMLQEMGLKVGSFTSPYIETFNERITINHDFISDKALIALVEKYQPLVEKLDQDEQLKGITEFELLTVMGFDYFSKEAVDVALIEVGLGGLLDSTNVISPILTGITTIGMDHTDILGETIEEIAFQKAGIIKPNVPLVTGNIEEKALTVIDERAQTLNAPTTRLHQEYEVTYQHPAAQWGEVFDFSNHEGLIKDLRTPLLGAHQVENAGLAIALLFAYCQQQQINVQHKWIREGLAKTTWPARMERISEEPLIILDGAHNDHAMTRLVDNLKKEFKGRNIFILFSALETKDISNMLNQLTKIPKSKVLITTFDNPRAIRLEKNYEAQNSKKLSVASLWQVGFSELLELATEDDVILITGSLYFVSEVRKYLKTLKGERQ